MKKTSFIIMLAICSLLLSSCSFSLGSATELMQPPKLSAKQADIINAATAYAGNEIVLQSPANGTSNSAIQYADIDSDGQAEAIIIYTVKGQDKSAKIQILDKNISDEWQSIYEIEGYGSVIDTINFVDFTGDSKVELISGWQIGKDGQKGFIISSLEQNGAKTLLKGSYSMMLLMQKYLQRPALAVLSYDKNASASASVSVIGAVDGSVGYITHCAVDGQVKNYDKMFFGKADKDSYAIFLDSHDTSGRYSTQLLMFNSILDESEYTLTPDNKAVRETVRESAILTDDINNDGIADMVSQVALKAPNNDNSAVMKLTKYKNYSQGKFSAFKHSIINISDNYEFTIPNNIVSNITAARNRQSGELEFFYIDNGVIVEQLFSLKVMSKSDYENQKLQSAAVKVAESSSKVVVATVFKPQTEGGVLVSLTQSQISEAILFY